MSFDAWIALLLVSLVPQFRSCRSSKTNSRVSHIKLSHRPNTTSLIPKMSSVTLDEHELLRKILETNKVKRELKRVDVKAPETGGDHFASRIEFWTVHFNDDDAPLDLFVKKSVANEKFANMLTEMQMFEKEAGFFNKFLPDMVNLLTTEEEEKRLLESSLPRCYYADSELVILENITKRGYAMLGTMVFHNLVQTKQVLRFMASLHGTSYGLIESIGLETVLKRYPYLRVATLWTESAWPLQGSLIEGIFKGTVKILETCPLPGSEKALEFVRQYQHGGFWKMAKLYDIDDPHSCGHVLNHGDLWTTNVMWKRNDGTDLKDNCLIIDFQTVHIGSPVLDLLYYLFWSMDATTRHAHWHDLLKEYYEALKTCSENIGTPTKFSFEDLLRDYRSKLELGFFLGMFQVFGLEGIEAMTEVDKIEGDMAGYFTSTIVATVEKNLATKGKQFSQKIIDAYNEYLNAKYGDQ